MPVSYTKVRIPLTGQIVSVPKKVVSAPISEEKLVRYYEGILPYRKGKEPVVLVRGYYADLWFRDWPNVGPSPAPYQMTAFLISSKKRKITRPNYKKHPVKFNPSITAQIQNWWNALPQGEITNLAASLGLRIYLMKSNWKYLTRQDKKRVKNYFLRQQFPYYSYNPKLKIETPYYWMKRASPMTWQHKKIGNIITLIRDLGAKTYQEKNKWYDIKGTYIATTKELHRLGWKAIL